MLKSNCLQVQNQRKEAQLMARERDCMVAKITTVDGQVDVLAGQGGFMGDGNAPDDFMGGLSPCTLAMEDD